MSSEAIGAKGAMSASTYEDYMDIVLDSPLINNLVSDIKDMRSLDEYLMASICKHYKILFYKKNYLILFVKFVLLVKKIIGFYLKYFFYYFVFEKQILCFYLICLKKSL